MKVTKQIILTLFLCLTLAFTGFAAEVDRSQGGKKRETPKEKRKDDDKRDRGGKRDDDRGKYKMGKRKNDD
jgi:hypothetical protein